MDIDMEPENVVDELNEFGTAIDFFNFEEPVNYMAAAPVQPVGGLVVEDQAPYPFAPYDPKPLQVVMPLGHGLQNVPSGPLFMQQVPTGFANQALPDLNWPYLPESALPTGTLFEGIDYMYETLFEGTVLTGEASSSQQPLMVPENAPENAMNNQDDLPDQVENALYALEFMDMGLPLDPYLRAYLRSIDYE